MTTEEGNKLIAEFMGWESGRFENLPNKLHKIDDGELCGISIDQLEYHTSWDWLMPVVEKIGQHHYPDFWGKQGKPSDANEWDDTAYPRTFGMRDDEGNYVVRINASTLVRGKTLIEATWLAVVDFIQWYNTQKTNP
jgi:hypothetical protein